ncbi:MAG: hypothetical protein EZS28_007691 [Streblomastix strix]|uniref:Uncharacterized protein n=1 Tax=Streblomastix strix TaxID=222440 RepID=A0A5J4WRS3_9EUKA|nr:MAG: hypothetical protein EZS28_007691 [Streblomastix strix]
MHVYQQNGDVPVQQKLADLGYVGMIICNFALCGGSTEYNNQDIDHQLNYLKQLIFDFRNGKELMPDFRVDEQLRKRVILPPNPEYSKVCEELIEQDGGHEELNSLQQNRAKIDEYCCTIKQTTLGVIEVVLNISRDPKSKLDRHDDDEDWNEFM